MKSINVFAMLSVMLVLLCPARAVFGTNGVFDVRDYGAAGDGTTSDTAAIQKAIENCSVTGGTVLFSPGTYVSGTLFMKSGVTLELMSGATLLGSPHLADYPVAEPNIRSYTDRYVCRSLIYGEDLENIGIVGAGTIDGNGHGPEFQEKGYTQRTRPYIIRFIGCRRITVNGVLLTRSPMWMQHYLACENIRMSGIRVFNHGNRNNDSVDIDGCRDVVISGCLFDSDDDGITLKSTLPRPCENVTITNCVVGSHCNAIKMGTESHGGFRNVTISDCVIRPSVNRDIVFGKPDGLAGIALEIVDGGIMEYVAISNISIESVGTPLFIRLGDRGRLYTEGVERPAPGMLRYVTISNITARGTSLCSSSISGIPGHPVKNVSLSRMTLICSGGGKEADAIREVPEVVDRYPESTMFGESLPSYGLYVRHVDGLSVSDLRMSLESGDERPAFVCDDVSGLDINGFSAAPPAGKTPIVWLVDTRDALINSARALPGTELFLSVTGHGTEHVTLRACALGRAREILLTGDGADPKMIDLE